jgi:hypothetical protein
MYDKEYFMLPKSPNGCTNIGTVSLDANELKFAADGSLTIHMSSDEPSDPGCADQLAARGTANLRSPTGNDT